MKKLISFLCAAALTVSSFAGLAVTASAETPKSVNVAIGVGDNAARVTTTDSSAVTGVLLLAKYTGNALTSLSVSIEFTTAENVALGAPYADGDKLMAWESLSSMKPITVTVTDPILMGEVSITGDKEVGAVLKADVSGLNTATGLKYEWSTATSADADTWTPVNQDVAKGTYVPTAAGAVKVKVTATGRDGSVESAPVTVTAITPTQDDNVTTEGLVTKVKVNADSTMAYGTSVGAALKDETTIKDNVTENAALTELYMNGLNGIDIRSAAYESYALLEFDDTSKTIQSMIGNDHLVSAVLVMPAGYSHSNARDFDIGVRPVKDWSDGTLESVGNKVKGNTVHFADNTTSPDTNFTVDITDILKSDGARQDGKYYFAACKYDKQAIIATIFSKEHTSGGSYIEFTVGYNVTYTYQDATGAPVAGLDVTLGGQTKKTDAEGKVTFSVGAGEHTATTAQTADVLATSTTATVTNDDVTAPVTTVNARVKTTLAVTAPESKEVIAGDATGITYTAVVKDQNEVAMTAEEAPVTWSILDSTDAPVTDGSVTVTDGKVTATAAATAGTYKVKAVAGGSTTDYTDTFTVKVVSPATVTVKYVDTENNPIGKEDTVITGIYQGEAYDLATAKPECFDQYKSSATAPFHVYNYDAAATGDVTSIASLAATQTITLKFTDEGEYYLYEDFEKDNSIFEGKSRVTVSVAKDDTLNSKVQSFVGAGNTQNGYGFSVLKNFPTLPKALVTVDFDYYDYERGIVTIGDASRGETGGSGKNSYSSAGAIFNVGITNNGKNSVIQGVETGSKTPIDGKWIHVHAVINETTKKVSYLITGADGQIAKADNVDYVDPTATSVGQIDVFGYINNGTQKIDNVKIQNADAPAVVKVPLTGVTLAAKASAAADAAAVADADITVGTVLVSTIAPADATGVTYEWYRGEDKIDGAT
ncbi:MAG: hypothetical protein IJG16_12925, partial [Clostridia bacterium]|nr:hypothetical protein [Clostridia bacterium]